MLPIVLFLVPLLGFAFGDKDPPVWSRRYAITGTLYIPYAGIEEPFAVWYDYYNLRSRIDYYGDMVQTYQLSGGASNTKFGISQKLVYITTEDMVCNRTCLKVEGSGEAPIEPQTILPDLKGFRNFGTEEKHGRTCEKWGLTESKNDTLNKYTMWLTYERDPTNRTATIAIPIRYEMRGYNNLLGSHYDYYYLEYNYLNPSEIPEQTFHLDPGFHCAPFPGPGAKHIYTFNPMAEFIHPVRNDHLDYEFNKFINKHDKEYNTTEHYIRKNNFRQNIRYIHAVNRQNRGFTLTVNHLADKNENELKVLRGKQYTGGYNGGAPFPYKNILKEDSPDQIDWRLLGAVTPVKDQAVCGSCWSFATVGAIEGAFYLKNGGKLFRFSEQALIDCSWGFGNNGCDGGEDFRAYQWMMKHKGIPTEEDYGPYLGQDGPCKDYAFQNKAPITGFVNVTRNDEAALRFAIFKHGPVSVSIDASHKTFTFYSNGVYFDPKCGKTEDKLDHAVLAVGYGTLNGEDYWLIKNSWSPYWGNNGYILMSAMDNNCGVMTTPTYVTM